MGMLGGALLSLPQSDYKVQYPWSWMETIMGKRQQWTSQGFILKGQTGEVWHQGHGPGLRNAQLARGGLGDEGAGGTLVWSKECLLLMTWTNESRSYKHGKREGKINPVEQDRNWRYQCEFTVSYRYRRQKYQTEGQFQTEAKARW